MSFFNLVMNPNFISAISDGQITTNGEITRTHFKKFECSPQGFVIGITGFELITNELRKKLYYQPAMTFEAAQIFLKEELERYQFKTLGLAGHPVSYNAIIAGFPSVLTENSAVPTATTFHIANRQMTEQHYSNSAVLSLVPDDIDFNPNAIINQYLTKFPKDSLLLHVQNLQRNALYRVADQSKTVNKVTFQEVIYPRQR